LIERAKALEEWQQRASQFETTKAWPVLLGRSDKLHEFAESDNFNDGFAESREAVFKEALSIDLEAFFEGQIRQFLEDMEEEEFEEDEEEVDGEELIKVDPTSLDIARKTSTRLVAIDGISAAKHTHVGIVAIPCSAPWEVLTIRPFAWQEPLSDAVLTATLKSWYERFGALPIGVLTDVLELWLPKPITDPHAASTTALEMFAICPDIVDQGTDTVQALAQELLNANIWFLWWD
jgi:hypothetical protein